MLQLHRNDFKPEAPTGTGHTAPIGRPCGAELARTSVLEVQGLLLQARIFFKHFMLKHSMIQYYQYCRDLQSMLCCPMLSFLQAGGWQGLSEPLVFGFPSDLKLPYESREVLLSKVPGS